MENALLKRLATVVALVFALPALAAPPEIEYAYPDQSVWTTRVRPDGEPDNPLLRLAGALFAKAGIPWHGQGYPAARMFQNLKTGTSQFSMLVKAPVLQECCLVGARPMAAAEIRVWRAKDAAPIHAKEDLAGKRVITIRGYSYGGLLTFLNDPANRVVNESALKHDSAFNMLAAGRADYVVDYAGPAAEVLAARPIPGITSDFLARQEVFLVLARSYPDAEAVMARLEAIADTLDVEAILAGR